MSAYASGMSQVDWGIGFEGYGLQLEGYGLQLEGYGLQLEGYGLQLEGYGLQLEGYGLQPVHKTSRISWALAPEGISFQTSQIALVNWNRPDE